MTVDIRNGSAERAGRTMLGAVRAAGELGLRTAELELAIDLGRIRAEPSTTGRPRVARAEVARLRAAPGFPDALRESVRTVGTADGSTTLGVTPARFAKLARLGCFEPVSFYCNRYGAVVWLYLAQELRDFAAERPELLAGPLPAPMRDTLDAGHDGRPRSWRQRRAAQLLNRTDDPWHTAAVMAAMLDADTLALVAEDPEDRRRLRDLRPRLVQARPETATGETARRLFLAEDHEELMWARVVIGLRLQALKETGPTQAGTEAGPPASPAQPPDPGPAVEVPADPPRRGLLGLLRRARRQPW